MRHFVVNARGDRSLLFEGLGFACSGTHRTILFHFIISFRSFPLLFLFFAIGRSSLADLRFISLSFLLISGQVFWFGLDDTVDLSILVQGNCRDDHLGFY